MWPSYLNDNNYTSFEPIETFNRTDADVAIWVLKNRAMFTDKVEDPFFKATTPYPIGTTTLYKTDFDISVLACTEQYSFCNAGDCTSLNGLVSFTAEVANKTLRYNPAQMATFDLVWRAAWASRAFTVLIQLGEQALLANSQALGYIRSSPTLPPNQWQLEIASVFNITLASMQRIMVQVASPPHVQITPNTTIVQYTIPPSTNEEKAICRSQKIMSGSAYYSFNFCGLLAILISGCVLIVIGNTIPATLHKRSRATNARQQHRLQEWNGNDVLHLQRQALEAQGLGSWSTVEGVPVMMPGYMAFKLPWITEITPVSSETDEKCASWDLESSKGWQVDLK